MVSLIGQEDLLSKWKCLQQMYLYCPPPSVASAGDLTKSQDLVYPGSQESALGEMTLESRSLTGVQEQEDMEGVKCDLDKGGTKE